MGMEEGALLSVAGQVRSRRRARVRHDGPMLTGSAIHVRGG